MRRILLRQGGRQTRRLRLHHRFRGEGLAELHRYRAAAVHRVPRTGRRVRPPRDDRAGEGNPDGAPLGRRASRVRDDARAREVHESEARGRRFRSGRRAPSASEAALSTF